MAQATKADRSAKAIGDKRLEKDGLIHFRTGLIKGTRYALVKDGSVRSVDPKQLTKHERRKEKKLMESHPQGVRFICRCNKLTYHFPSHTKMLPEGYEQKVKVDTYECSVCGEHFERDVIHQAVQDYATAQEAAKKKEALSGSQS